MIYEIMWMILIPGMIMHWFSIIRNYNTLVENKFETYEVSKFTKKIIFSITTRNCPSFVQDGINSIHKSCKKTGLTNYEVKIVTDNECDVSDANVVLVPKDYTCNSKYKSRSLNYSLKFLPNSNDVWTFHMDEDSKIVEQTIRSIVKYINNGGNPISNGLSVFTPNKSLLGFFAESHRLWTFLWLKQQLKMSPLWMNGSNMLLRTDLEHEIGWEHGNLFSEDTSFAYAVSRKNGNIFGWHGGLTIESAANEVMSTIHQRKRWYYGGIIYFMQCPNKLKPFRAYSAISWMLGFYLTILYFASVLGLYDVSPLFIGMFTITMIFWYTKYQMGLHYILKYNEQKTSIKNRLIWHCGLLILTPIVELTCTFPTLYAWLDRPKKFVITNK